MLVGHVGAAMALNRLDRRINLGFVVLAATLLDVLFWLFVIFGWERVIVPADYVHKHYLLFDFPFSHSLLSAGCYSVIAGSIAWLLAGRFKSNRTRVGLVIGAAVLSHWVLDLLVHVPDLPLLSDTSAKVGISLWRHTGMALAVESLVALGGLWLYLTGAGLTRNRRIGLAVFVGLLIAFTVMGQTAAPPPDNITQVAAVSLVMNLALAVATYFITGRRLAVRTASA